MAADPVERTTSWERDPFVQLARQLEQYDGVTGTVRQGLAPTRSGRHQLVVQPGENLPGWARGALERRPRPLGPLGRRLHVLGARELARDIDVRATVRLLERMGSVFDGRVYMWVPGSRRWRLLTLEEHKLLWRFRGRV